MISDHALDVIEQVPTEKVGAVELFVHLVDDVNNHMLDRAQAEAGLVARNAEEMYRNAGLPLFTHVVQAGVLVLNPSCHQNILENVYNEGLDTPSSFFEMMPLSAELMEHRSVHWLDGRFNHTIMEVLLRHYPFLLATHSNAPLLKRLKKRIIRELFLRPCLDAAVKNTWFFHFAGYGVYMDAIDYWRI